MVEIGGMLAREIIPGALYQRGRTNRVLTATKERAARELGLRHVVSVCSDIDEQWCGLGGVRRVLHRPFPDGQTVMSELVTALAQDLTARVEAGEPVLVYCAAGKNRSSLVNALILMNVMGWDGDRAIAHIRQCRPGALENQAFVDYLLEVRRR